MSTEETAIFLANAYVAAGVCVEDAKNLKQAARDYDQAYRAFESAVNNAAAGGAATVGAAAGAGFCLLGGPTLVTAACLAGFGIATISGELWTASAIESMQVAEDEIEDQNAALDRALTALCKCVHDHVH